MEAKRNGAGSMPDPAETAELARLTYVDEETPGILRRRCGRGFIYIGPSGERISDNRVITRIKSLVIPPAWEEVWIALKANGHIQATGRDARGRKQYLYHPKWQEARNQNKFGRLLSFGRTLPSIREQVDRDLSINTISKQRAAAFVVRLLDITHMRIGNREYARMNRSYGLTTLREDHLEICGSRLRFDFPGKGGKRQILDIYDRRLARLAKKLQDLPGQELVRYRNGSGEYQTLESGDVNAYVEEITGVDFTAKEFRTWGGTVLTAAELYNKGPAESKKSQKKSVTQAIKNTAKRLGNTPTICRKYYVHPAVIEGYACGDLFSVWKQQESEVTQGPHEATLEERVVLVLLENHSVVS
ncbi:MAG: DNA topoisomerase IB [Desulfobacteraceae bacterium]|nr:MAG: DNA topoisomerase IB [Desulfobacteraceae bacterium]